MTEPDTARRFAAAGFLATAVTYGPARMGFGLFLPAFREAFALSSTAAGAIAGGAFLAFLLAILLAGYMTRLHGPRAPVVAGLAAATAGMGLVALSGGAWTLAAGVVLAGTSAGLAWSPFNNAAARLVEEAARPTVLSVISTGTTVGVATAGALTLATVTAGLSWRVSWALFALAAGAATFAATRILGALASARGSGEAGSWRAVLRPELAWPCLAALSFGATSSVFLAFAPDRVVRAGALAAALIPAVPALVFLAYGLAGLLGLASAWFERRLGLVGFLVAIFLAATLSNGLVARAPGSLVAVLAAAGLQGICVMTTSAVLAFWSARIFPDMPSTSFTAVLLSLATGGVAGPALAGATMAPLGAEAVFLAAAGCALATALALAVARRRIRTAAAAP